jgi:PKD repeat protein
MKRSIILQGVYLFVAGGLLLAMGQGCKKDNAAASNAPNASFTYTSSRIFPVLVQFNNQSTSSIPGISTFIWDFGDGSTSTVTSPAHTYTTPGTYQVALVQTYGNGTKDTAKQVLPLIVNGPAGTSTGANGITATAFTFTIAASYNVAFTNRSTNASSYLWDFGDGSSSTSAATTVTHIYNGAGPFKVILQATNDEASDSCSAILNF